MTASNMGKAINSLASFIFSSFSRYPRSPSTVARMDANQYRTALRALRLNQTTAARFLGVAVSTSHNYAQGKSPVPEQIAMLLSVMIHLKIGPIEARETAGLPIDDYRGGRAKE